MSVALYIRVSSQEQANEGYSIGEQEQRLTSYCDALGWEIYQTYIDPGFTGSNINRPALQSLLKDANAHRFNRVVVYKLDRLSRSQKDTLELIEDRFLKNNIDFVSISENFDTSTPLGRAMIGILAVFAQLEREQIKERMQMGKMARAKEGKWCGGSVSPYGYQYQNDLLVPDETQRIHIEEMFKLAAEGWGPTRIAYYFNSQGYPCNNAGKIWTDMVVRRILHNEVYIGKINFFGQTFQGIHEPLVPEELFTSVQNILTHRSEHYEKQYPSMKGQVTYLGGYLYCARCGAKYQHRIAKYKKGDYLKVYSYYSCNSVTKRNKKYIKNPNCDNITWKHTDLENAVFAEMRKLTIGDFDSAVSSRPESLEKKSLTAEIESIDKKINRLMDLYMMDGIPKDKVQAQLQSLTKQKAKFENRLENIKEDKDLPMKRNIIKSVSDILEHGSYEDIRDLIGLLIDRIEIDGEDITIHWNF